MQQTAKILKTALLMTGNELISGDTIDSNSAFLGQVLPAAGLEIQEKVTVGDNLHMLVYQLQRLASQYELILLNGGLGPTQDDLTASALSHLSQTALVEHSGARAHVENWCKKRNIPANAANLSQAMLPESADIFPHAPGSASAFYLQYGQCLIIATPGIPSEMKKIVQEQMIPFLQQRYRLSAAVPWRQYQLFGIGESSLQQLLDEHFARLNKTLDIGFRVNFPYIELKLRPWPDSCAEQASKDCKALLSYLDDYLLGPANSTMAEALVNRLQGLNKTVSSAESCTGGRIAAEITAVAGASDVFPGSIVCYSNHIKQQLLQVKQKTLDEQGAVSQATVLQMLAGLLRQTGSDYGVAVSGIAGPGGGSPDKPTGTVWLAWGDKEEHYSVCLCIKLERTMFQLLVSTVAMDLLRRQAGGLNCQPPYLQRWQVY